MTEFQFDQPEYETPKSNPVMLPAIFLIISVAIAMLASAIDGAGRIYLLATGAEPPAVFGTLTPEQRKIAAVVSVIILLTEILTFIAGPIVIIGAIRMIQRRSHGFCRMAAILAIAFVSGGCCCFWLTLPFGLWALVLLNKPEVKAQFLS